MNQALRHWLIAAVASVLLILLSIAYLDHPIATFIEQHFRHTEGWRILAGILSPTKIVAVAAILFLFWAGFRRMANRPLSRWSEMPLTLACAVTWALATEFVFKQIFGRAWPEPTYIRDHLDGFHFLHAGDGWMSFPSGHALSSFALAAVCWSTKTGRGPMLILAVLTSASMVLCNYHWLSDVIAGAILGWSIGSITASSRPHCSLRGGLSVSQRMSP